MDLDNQNVSVVSVWDFSSQVEKDPILKKINELKDLLKNKGATGEFTFIGTPRIVEYLKNKGIICEEGTSKSKNEKLLIKGNKSAIMTVCNV